MNATVSIMVAAHKEYQFPTDTGYLPLQVGRELSTAQLQFTGDNTGKNISTLNKSFCELTGLYWLWKNKKSDYYGLSHYRRYFRPIKNSVEVAGQKVATSADLVKLLDHYEIILSNQRNYWVESVRQHYCNAHHPSDLKALEQVIYELHPAYSESFEVVMNRRTVSLYNMFVMRADSFDKYCEWLFSILFELANRIPYQTYGPYQGRVFGFLSERLLNVWIEKNYKKTQIKYLPVVNLEGENLLKKAMGLLERKFKDVKQA